MSAAYAGENCNAQNASSSVNSISATTTRLIKAGERVVVVAAYNQTLFGNASSITVGGGLGTLGLDVRSNANGMNWDVWSKVAIADVASGSSVSVQLQNTSTNFLVFTCFSLTGVMGGVDSTPSTANNSSATTASCGNV